MHLYLKVHGLLSALIGVVNIPKNVAVNKAVYSAPAVFVAVRVFEVMRFTAQAIELLGTLLRDIAL